jgi:dTDP-4-dehydrorhamnose reductase
MKIFLTGGTGQVGFELQRSLALFGAISAPNSQELDLSDPQATAEYINKLQPDLIVNAAAWAAVDGAETEQRAAFRLNAELPRQLAEYTKKQNIWLIHYSTDYVYPGNGSTPWQEDSPTGPLSIYGSSKLAGDRAIEEAKPNYLIFRTSWVYAARGKNFLNTMLKLGSERDKLSVVSDQVGAPTPARLIAEVTALAIGNLQANLIPSGVYHLCSSGETNWHEFASEIFKYIIDSGLPLAIEPSQVDAITSEQYPAAANRPLNSRLSTEKLERTLGIELPHWKNQLILTLKERELL